MFPKRSRTAPTTPTLSPTFPSPLSPLTPLTPPKAFVPPTPHTYPPVSAPKHEHGRHSAPLGERTFLTAIANEFNPPVEPHPILAEPMPPPHAMAEYIRELRLRLVDTEEEIEYLQTRVRRVEVDNHYLCRQVTALTEQREELRDRLEGRKDKRKEKERENGQERGRKDGKVYKEAHYA